jgi:hypothetical protein
MKTQNVGLTAYHYPTLQRLLVSDWSFVLNKTSSTMPLTTPQTLHLMLLISGIHIVPSTDTVLLIGLKFATVLP